MLTAGDVEDSRLDTIETVQLHWIWRKHVLGSHILFASVLELLYRQNWQANDRAKYSKRPSG